jgi:hypothetical protein
MSPRKAKKENTPEEIPFLDDFFDVSKGVIPSQEMTRKWPYEITEKHAQRHASIIQEMRSRREFKQQRLTENGVPPEKRIL